MSSCLKAISIIMLFFYILSSNASPISNSNTCYGKQIAGGIENIKLTTSNIILLAKLDTGAAMSSLNAQDITFYQKNKKTWVKFVVVLPANNKKIIVTAPFIRYVAIRNRAEENTDKSYSMRPVISLKICLAQKTSTILVNLSDRSQFNYAMLLGADALAKLNLLVDVSQHNLTIPRCTN